MSNLDRQMSDMRAATRPAPPISTELQAVVVSAAAAKPRRPLLQYALLKSIALGLAALLIIALGLRADLGGLPRIYVYGVGFAWAATVGVLSFIATTPPRGSALLRWRQAGIGALLAGGLFIALGLLWTESMPGVSLQYEATAANVIRWAPYCLAVGTGSSLIPIALATLLLRRTTPLGARWVGAGVGALGGCVGGLVLHLHCHIAEETHFGFVHGGVVFIAAGLGALVLPRFTRP